MKVQNALPGKEPYEAKNDWKQREYQVYKECFFLNLFHIIVFSCPYSTVL